MLQGVQRDGGLHLLDGELVLLSQLVHLGLALLIGDLHILRGGHSLQGQLGLDLVQGGGLGGGTHHLGGHAHHLQVVIHGHSLAGHPHGVFVHDLVQLGLHHAVGDVGLQIVHQLLQNGLLEIVLGLGGAALGQLLAQVLLEVGQSLELRHILGELVVHRGDLGLLDLLDLDLEHHGLAGQVGHIVLGEGDVQILLVTSLQADELILKAGNEGAGADLQAVILALATLEGLAVLKALEVDDGGIAQLDLTVHRDQAGSTADIRLQFILHILISNADLSLGGGEALVLLHLGLGADRNQGSKDQALLLVDLHDVHDGVAHILQALLLHSGLIGTGIDVVDGILIKHAGAVHPLNDLAGGLALPEAGDGDAGAALQVSLLNRSLKLVGFHMDRQLDCAVFFLFDVGDLHVTFPPVGAGGRARNPLPGHSLPRRILSPRYFIRYMSV